LQYLRDYCNPTDLGIRKGKTAGRYRRTKNEYDTLLQMDEGRKRVILIASAILVARYLKTPNELFGYKASPATESLIANAIRIATRIMDKIDNVNN
jgi:hypothetical protein